MQFLKAFFFGSAALVSLVVAQQTDRLALTGWPDSIQAGEVVTVEYTGNPTATTTLSLRKGDPGALDPPIVSQTGTGGVITFTAPADLVDGQDYAFEISQPGAEPNFSGQFAVTGGTGEAVNTESASSTPSAASATETATESGTATETVTASDVSTTPSSTVTVTETAQTTPASIRSNSTMTTSTNTNSRDLATRTSTSATGTRTSAPTQSTAGAAALSGNVAFAVGAFAAIAYLF